MKNSENKNIPLSTKWNNFVERLKEVFGDLRVYSLDWTHLANVNGFGVIVFDSLPSKTIIPSGCVFEISRIQPYYILYYHDERKFENGKYLNRQKFIAPKDEFQAIQLGKIHSIAKLFFVTHNLFDLNSNQVDMSNILFFKEYYSGLF